jgi:2-deoxy-D-gluconate 3-dehydrogenase
MQGSLAMASAFDLTGKVCLVTGGNGGIGLGMARGFARAGATVVIAARNAVKAKAAVAELSALGASAHSLQVDVADETACRAMVADVQRLCGRLDVLVNNAGIARAGPPETMPMTAWNSVIATNLTAVLVASQAAHPLMKAQGGGKIINIGSMYSIFGSAAVVSYAASKGGVIQLTKSLAVAWAGDNIQVNAVLPGWIDTEMTQGARGTSGFSDAIVARTPAGRWGEIDDFEGPAVFLASAASDFVTGISLPVDGGYAVS